MFNYNIPMDETDIQELKDSKILLKGKLPLYFTLITDMIDNIYITDYKNNNLHIGEIVVDYENNVYNIFIYEDSPLGNMAIELLDQMIDQNLVMRQVRVQFGVYDEEDLSSFGLLTLRVGMLGELQEDFYAAYFLGSTMRPYGYDKEDYYKRNFSEDELEEAKNDQEPISGKTSLFSKIFGKLFRRK